MNLENIDLKSPKNVGWHWWKATKDSQAISINVSESDIQRNKFKNFGGEWHQYPTYNEVMEYRQAYYDLSKTSSDRIKVLESALSRFIGFLQGISNKTFTQKSEIKEFLDGVQKTSTQEPPHR